VEDSSLSRSSASSLRSRPRFSIESAFSLRTSLKARRRLRSNLRWLFLTQRLFLSLNVRSSLMSISSTMSSLRFMSTRLLTTLNHFLMLRELSRRTILVLSLSSLENSTSHLGLITSELSLMSSSQWSLRLSPLPLGTSCIKMITLSECASPSQSYLIRSLKVMLSSGTQETLRI